VFELYFSISVLELISTELGHIFMHFYHLWLLFEKKLVRTPPGINPPQPAGPKNRFCDRLWTSTEHISATKHDINNRKETCQSAGTPLYVPYFNELWSRNGWKRLASFCPPCIKFSHSETLPALPHGRYVTDIRQTLARVMYSGTSLDYRTTECRAGSRLALPCI